MHGGTEPVKCHWISSSISFLPTLKYPPTCILSTRKEPQVHTFVLSPSCPVHIPSICSIYRHFLMRTGRRVTSNSRHRMEWLAQPVGRSQEQDKQWALWWACDSFHPPLDLELLAAMPGIGHTVSLTSPKFPHMGPQSLIFLGIRNEVKSRKKKHVSPLWWSPLLGGPI